ncbi:hypothetical protein SteCoe_21381 [Stentor coeruleus]|uniref:Uncharacterized protein n=1 Tax=Stentor coeruleus TaxID=5963 RepID=A0A1R2BPN6_9CILI|nr:hypothetical protein SteCoe_21381 [Stentor coeruleus]
MSSVNKYPSPLNQPGKYFSKSPDFASKPFSNPQPFSNNPISFQHLPKKSPFSSEQSQKSQPFSQFRQIPSQNSQVSPFKILNPDSQNAKPFESPTSFPRLVQSKPSPFSKNLNRLDKSYEIPSKPQDFSYKNLRKTPTNLDEETFIQNLEQNHISYLEKLKKTENIQKYHQKQYEKNIINSANSKEQNLDLLIEKRMIARSKKEQKEVSLNDIKRSPGRKHYADDSNIDLQWDENINSKNNDKDKPINNIKIIEDIRKNQKNDIIGNDFIKKNDEDFNKNIEKFFGTEKPEGEKDLFGSSIVIGKEKNSQSFLTYGKTSVRTTTYDPITDSTTKYENNRAFLRPLGGKKNEPFPGKISDAEGPQLSDYNRSFRTNYESTNPLTGEIKQFNKMLRNGDDSERKYQFVVTNGGNDMEKLNSRIRKAF